MTSKVLLQHFKIFLFAFFSLGFYPVLSAQDILDTNFNSQLGTGFNNDIYALALQPDGKVLVGGDFLNLNFMEVPDNLVRLNNNGSTDTNFNNFLGSGFNSYVAAVILQPDHKILVAGGFTALNNSDIPDGLVRFNSNGTLDVTFTNNLGLGLVNGGIFAIALQTNQILVGGSFSVLNTTDVPNNLIRLNNNGLLDSTFTNALGVGFDNNIYALATQADNKILVGGGFSKLNNTDVSLGLVRLNYNGTLDSTFTNIGVGFSNNGIFTIALQTNKILVGGSFDSLNGVDIPDGLIRLNDDGALDSTFTNAFSSGFNSPVSVITVQPDNKILVGGNFTTFNGINISKGLIRINEDNTLDTNFTNTLGTGFDADVFACAVTHQKILVAGDFTFLNGIDVPNRLVQFLTPNLTNDNTTNIVKETLEANSGDFTSDGGSDVLFWQRGVNNALRLLDVSSSNHTEAIRSISIPLKAKFLAANRIGNTNYFTFKTGKTITVSSFGITNTLKKISDLASVTLDKQYGKVVSSGDVNYDGILDLITIKGKKIQAVYGAQYNNGAEIQGLLTNEKLPGKAVGMFGSKTTNGYEWMLAFQKGKQASSYFITTNLNAVIGPSIKADKKIRGMSGSKPITQKNKLIKIGDTYTYTNSKANYIGKPVGPK